MAVHTVNITLDEGADIKNVLRELVENMPEVERVETLDGLVIEGMDMTDTRRRPRRSRHRPAARLTQAGDGTTMVSSQLHNRETRRAPTWRE